VQNLILILTLPLKGRESWIDAQFLRFQRRGWEGDGVADTERDSGGKVRQP